MTTTLPRTTDIEMGVRWRRRRSKSVAKKPAIRITSLVSTLSLLLQVESNFWHRSVFWWLLFWIQSWITNRKIKASHSQKSTKNMNKKSHQSLIKTEEEEEEGVEYLEHHRIQRTNLFIGFFCIHHSGVWTACTLAGLIQYPSPPLSNFDSLWPSRHRVDVRWPTSI